MKPTQIRTLAREIAEGLFYPGAGVAVVGMRLNVIRILTFKESQRHIEAIIRKRVEKKGKT